MSKLIQATVKFPYKEMETRFGKRSNVVFLADNGIEIKYWSDPGNTELQSLKKNQKVTLVKSDDDKYSILNDTQQPTNADPYSMFDGWQPWPDEHKKKLSNEAGQLIDLYSHCYKQVKQKMPELKEEESFRSIATGIFIQVLRNN